ncbi:MerR family transcriptional regulator [Paenibacillus turpanensis]|uniref:MerR family transcriptional regulator n=1 Tax=Paenibacillus turpanensis TaxID=2689078 RepID=UPI00140C9C94|nr:MerR family transcriptional regulator [Paenibacillus turpanensis]
MEMKVKEVAALTGVSVRTLHHYDHIGLLSPSGTTVSGYRLYSEKNLERLQQILFFKELGFSLKEIKKMIDSPSFDRQEAFILQRKMLIHKRNSIDKMIESIDKSIQHMRGEIRMTNEERFEGFHFRDDPYEQEARQRWGDQSVDNLKHKVEKMSVNEQNDLSEKWDAIFRTLAGLCTQSPASPEVQASIQEWYDFLNENVTTYTLDAFYGLGQLYIEDERFTNNIDQYGEGLAKFMNKAMKEFVEKQT